MADERPSIRLQWIDGMKGISILWIAFFHGFNQAFGGSRFPRPLSAEYLASMHRACGPTSWIGEIGCALESLGVAVSQLGFHAVSVFLVLSGFGLTYSLAKTGEPPRGWIGWYRSRLLRLFPMYWIAHFVYLVSPFQARYETIDYRFVLSFFGDRIWPLETIFYYFNPALWYFGLLLELYLVFPLLFRLLQRLGVTPFLLVCAAATFGCRYVLLCVWPVNGYWVQGAFFVPRLWEFALGMTMGLVARESAASAGRRLFSPVMLCGGIILYTLGLYSYGAAWSYTFTDGLIGTGLAIVLAHVARGCERAHALGVTLATVGTYSYGLYLLHQPYVLYVADRSQSLSTPAFVASLIALIAVLTLASMAIERRVNQLAQRALG
jgi:peptidoglycan/LPS O-acetylase OafA/YrhL